MKYRILLIFALLSLGLRLAAEIAIPFDRSWKLPPSGAISESTLTISATDPAVPQLASHPIDPEPYFGRSLIVRFEVKYSDVSKPKESYNGVKLMIHYFANGKQYWTNCSQLYGSSDWKTVTVEQQIPGDTEWISLETGLQGSTGKLQVRNVELVDWDPKELHRPPVPLPENFRCEYTERVLSLPQLRGMMSPVVYRSADFPAMREWNVNLLRWQLRPQPREGEKYADLLDRDMNILDKVLEQCQKLGIMVIIDLHRVPGGKEFNHGVVQEEAKLYDNPEFAEEFVESWRKLARRYRDCPVVYAYDLINEPNQKTPRRIDYLELQYRAAKAIREIDPETPICVTSNDWSSPRYFSYLHPLPLKNIIYNVHMYRPLTYTHQRVVPALTRIYTYPGNVDGKYWDKDALRRCLAPVREFQQKYGARIVMSEFSVIRWAPGGEQYLADLLALAEEYQWDWCYHSFREWDGWDLEYGNQYRDTSSKDLNNPRLKLILDLLAKNQKLDLSGGSWKSQAVPLPAVTLTSEVVKKQLTDGRRLDETASVPTLEISRKTPGNTFVTIPLPLSILGGQEVVLSGEIAHKAISKKPKSHNGVKMMLVITSFHGNTRYLQVPTREGDSDWRKYALKVEIPSDARKLELHLGLEGVSGTAKFRNIQFSEPKPQIDHSRSIVTGELDRDNAVSYKPGEPMKFRFRILQSGNPIGGRLRVVVAGDDGSRREDEYDLSADRPLELTASLNQPGFVMAEAKLIDDYGNEIQRKRGNSMKAVQFGLAAGVQPEKLTQAVAEPADFDKFWESAKAELKAAPLRVLERKLFKTTLNSHIYDVKLSAPGPRPTVGSLAIPKDAQKKSLPLHIQFDGYGVRDIVAQDTPGKIVFFVGAHGLDLHREPTFYQKLSDGELYGYGFDDRQNENPHDCYFKYMILRDLRAVQYAVTLPEWDGRNLTIAGGSQGAFQAAAVTALTPEATRCELEVPWFCELGGITAGRIRGWRPNWKKGLGYYDTVNFARRIKCPAQIEAGLSDWVCPPSGVWCLYNVLPGSKRMKMFQGRNHGPYFGYDQKKAPFVEINQQ